MALSLAQWLASRTEVSENISKRCCIRAPWDDIYLIKIDVANPASASCK
jgi:hypothetical protein